MIADLYLNSDAPAPRLRIGVMVDGEMQLRVFANILENVQASNFAELALVIWNCEASAAPAAAPRLTPAGRLLRRFADPGLRASFLFDLYSRFNARHMAEDAPESLIDASHLLTGLPRVDVVPLRKGFVHRFPDEALAAVREHRLDVILRFGFNILKGGALDCARYGIWSYHHGDNDFYRGGPAHFWELYERNPYTGVILQRLTEELDGGLVLAKAVFETADTPWVSANRYDPYWDTAHFVIWKLWELHRRGWEYLVSRSIPHAPYRGRRKLYRRPSNADLARWLPTALLSGRATTHSRVAEDVRHYDGARWWLFQTLSDRAGKAKLMLFSGPTPDGPWHPHPANPISWHVATARCAGPLLARGGRLWRPLAAPGSGACEIVICNEYEYEERPPVSFQAG